MYDDLLLVTSTKYNKNHERQQTRNCKASNARIVNDSIFVISDVDMEIDALILLTETPNPVLSEKVSLMLPIHDLQLVGL